jgi:hypothetical protein
MSRLIPFSRLQACPKSKYHIDPNNLSGLNLGGAGAVWGPKFRKTGKILLLFYKM